MSFDKNSCCGNSCHNNYLKNGTEFINYTEVQGYYNTIKITATDSWKTTIYNYTLPVKLPKTGN